MHLHLLLLNLPQGEQCYLEVGRFDDGKFSNFAIPRARSCSSGASSPGAVLRPRTPFWGHAGCGALPGWPACSTVQPDRCCPQARPLPSQDGRTWGPGWDATGVAEGLVSFCASLFCFLKKQTRCLLLEREEGQRETAMWERSIDLLPPTHIWTWGRRRPHQDLQPGVCPDLESNPQSFCYRTIFQPLNHAGQGSLCIFKWQVPLSKTRKHHMPENYILISQKPNKRR